VADLSDRLYSRIHNQSGFADFLEHEQSSAGRDQQPKPGRPECDQWRSIFPAVPTVNSLHLTKISEREV
jgi:hypothetical protein